MTVIKLIYKIWTCYL